MSVTFSVTGVDGPDVLVRVTANPPIASRAAAAAAPNRMGGRLYQAQRLGVGKVVLFLVGELHLRTGVGRPDVVGVAAGIRHGFTRRGIVLRPRQRVVGGGAPPWPTHRRCQAGRRRGSARVPSHRDRRTAPARRVGSAACQARRSRSTTGAMPVGARRHRSRVAATTAAPAAVDELRCRRGHDRRPQPLRQALGDERYRRAAADGRHRGDARERNSVALQRIPRRRRPDPRAAAR